jgi:hypothetical protein
VPNIFFDARHVYLILFSVIFILLNKIRVSGIYINSTLNVGGLRFQQSFRW